MMRNVGDGANYRQESYRDVKMPSSSIEDGIRKNAKIRARRAKLLDPRREDENTPRDSLALGRLNDHGRKMMKAIYARTLFSLGQTLLKQFERANYPALSDSDSAEQRSHKFTQWHWERMRLGDTFLTTDEAALGLLTPEVGRQFNMRIQDFLCRELVRPNSATTPPSSRIYGRVFDWVGDELIQRVRHHTIFDCLNWQQTAADRAKYDSVDPDPRFHFPYRLEDNEALALKEVGFYRPEHFLPREALEGQLDFFRDCKYFSDLCDTYVAMRASLVRDAGHFDLETLREMWGIDASFIEDEDARCLDEYSALTDFFVKDRQYEQKLAKRKKIIELQRMSFQKLALATCFWATNDAKSEKDVVQGTYALFVQLGSFSADVG